MDNFFIFGAKYLYIAIGGVAFFYFIKQPKAVKKEMLIISAIALPSIFAVAKFIGLFYYSALPFVEGDFTPLIPHEADNGFPSDHVLLGAAISSIVYFFDKKLSVALWALTIIVGLSRIYASVHHFIDVAGSIVVAILVTALVYGLILGWKKYMVRKNTGT